MFLPWTLAACVGEVATDEVELRGGWSDGPYVLVVSESLAYFGDTCVIGAELDGPYVATAGVFSWSGTTVENASGSAVRAVVLEGTVDEDETITAALRYADESTPFVDAVLTPDDISYATLEFCEG